MAEREPGKETIHYHKVIAGAVAYYYQGFLDQAGEAGIILDESHKMVRGVRRFLGEYKTLMGGVMPTHDELLDFKNQTMEMADLQKKAKLEGMGKKDFLRKYKGQYDTGMLGSWGKPWLVKTYEKGFFKNMLDIYLGKLKFGFGGDVDRDEPDNAWASDMLMDTASDRIVVDLAEIFKDSSPEDIITFEMGGGSGNFSSKVMEALPGSISKVSDINPETQSAARENLTGKGLIEGKDFELIALDMSDSVKLKEIAEELKEKKIIIHIGYILHENRNLALRTLKALSGAFGGLNVLFVFTEYAMQDEITEDVPLHFQGIHYTTQDLFYRDEFLETVKAHGFSRFKGNGGEELETVHNYVSKKNQDGTTERVITNSSTYWTI